MTLASLARTPTRVSIRVAAPTACLVAGGIHLWVMPEHLVVSLPAGIFFLVVGCAQLVLAAVLVVESPGVRALTGIAVAHLGLVALYVLSRTRDLPFAPAHAAGGHVDADDVAAAAPGGVGNGVPLYPGSRTEPVGVLDLVCIGAEVALVALLVGALTPRARTIVLDAALVLALTTLAFRLAG